MLYVPGKRTAQFEGSDMGGELRMFEQSSKEESELPRTFAGFRGLEFDVAIQIRYRFLVERLGYSYECVVIPSIQVVQDDEEYIDR